MLLLLELHDWWRLKAWSETEYCWAVSLHQWNYTPTLDRSQSQPLFRVHYSFWLICVWLDEKKKLGCPEHLGGCVYEWVLFLYMVLSNFPCYKRIQCTQTCYSAYIISFVCMSVVFKLKAEGSELVLQIWFVLIGMKPPCGVLKTSRPYSNFAQSRRF
jgi:hypothetical protein